MELGFVGSYVQHKCCVLAYMTLVVGGMYWRRNGIFLYTCLLQSGTHWKHSGVNQ